MITDDVEMLSGDDLAKALCELLEVPPVITARAARKEDRAFFEWVTCCDYASPKGWWVAEIGTDHGPESTDDDPVRWRPLPEITDLIELAWRVFDEMKTRGWLLHVLGMTEGYVVYGNQYALPADGDWKKAWGRYGVVQVTGDSAPEAICRAALAALRSTSAPTPPAAAK